MTDYGQLSDGELVRRVRDGDDRAVGELYDRFGRSAFGVALRVTANPTLAEEAVQEAFVDVWRRADGYEIGQAKLATWVLTIVHRRAVDLVRREGRQRARVSRLAEDIHVEASVELAGPIVERDRVRAALERLPPEQREAIVLTYFGGLSQPEAAEHLGEPLGTIKSRIFTAMARLRQALDEDVQATRSG